MRRPTILAALFGFVFTATLSIGSRSVLANGDEFFYPPAGEGGKVKLVYFGLIKDAKTGRPLDRVEVTVWTDNAEIKFLNDKPGHFRSPDIGAYYDDTGQTFNPAATEIVATKQGYAPATRKVPVKTTGGYNIDLMMTPETGARK